MNRQNPGQVITGFVTDNQDPDKMGRVKIRIYLSEKETVSDWLPVIQSYAGDDRGIFNLPDIDDLVLAFFADDTWSTGWIIGSTWPQSAALPGSEENPDADFNSDGYNSLHMLRSRSGQRIIIDDTEGAEKIQLLNPDGTCRLELNGEEESINLITETNITISAKTAVAITADELTIETEGDVTVSCDNLGVEASGDGLLKAGGSITLEGKGVALN